MSKDCWLQGMGLFCVDCTLFIMTVLLKPRHCYVASAKDMNLIFTIRCKICMKDNSKQLMQINNFIGFVFVDD